MYSDGTESPALGSRTDFNDQLEVGGELSKVGVRAWKENFVQTLSLTTADGCESKIEGQKQNGEMTEFEVPAGKRLIGIHGFLDGNDDVRGFGLILI